MTLPNVATCEYMTVPGKNEHNFFIAELKGEGDTGKSVRMMIRTD